MTSYPTPTVDDVRAAADRIRSFVYHTPLVRSTWLSELTRADVWLKLDFVQPTGSFKLRGATNAVRLLHDRDPGAKAVTASAGNHGLGVAWAASTVGVDARIHLPTSAPAAKRGAIAKLGAEIVDAPSYEAAEMQAREDAARSGCTYLSPYNHPDVIAGAGTVALEILNDRPDLDTLIVPLGGGGLLSGCAIVARSFPRAPSPKPPPSPKASAGPRRSADGAEAGFLLIGAEAAASPVFTSALAAGRTVPVDVHPTVADGLAGNMEPDSETFDIVRDLVDRVTLVEERFIRDAMRGLIAHERFIVEGAAATAVGALLQGNVDLSGRRIAVVLSGRNVDREVIRTILTEPDGGR